MDPDNLAKLNQHRPLLVQNMNGMRVLDHLLAASIFNDHHAKEIEFQKLQDSEDKNRRLLDILKTKGAEAFHQFIAALRATNQHSLTAFMDRQSPTEDLQQIQNITQESLKQKYLVKFRYVYPFSLPFTFDIESTWVSLALKEDSKNSQATQDHAKLLERAFEKAKMLIIEGDPASGKTSLMRKFAYEWAKAPQHYNLVIYAEFRTVREKSFTSITDLVLGCSKEYLENEEFERLAFLLNNKQFCIKHSILVLLDGYDESSLDKQCSELQKYLFNNTINNQLLFNVVITTRKGYLSNLRGFKGRFIYADVLGFTTDEQKKKYISNHFSSVDNSAENVKAVHQLLEINKNMDKLAETPLFLTFICLVHEKIVDGTLLELYCNTIQWLIDRHQKDFPGRNIPDLFGFKIASEIGCDEPFMHENSSIKKFNIIKANYLRFSQLHCLGKMALHNLDKNAFEESDCKQFGLRKILLDVGLLNKNEPTTAFSFPHRTIQEFLAAFYCFISDENTDQWFPTNSKMNTDKMKEYDKFLLRIALSNESKTLPIHLLINTTKHKIYFERIKRISNLILDLTFDAVNIAAGLNNELLNWFISQCTNIRILQFNGPNKTIASLQNHLTFTNLFNLHSLTFNGCIIQEDSQISFTHCPSLKSLGFIGCEIKSSASIGITKLPALDTLQFDKCTIDLEAWQSITDEITRSSVKQLELDSDFFEKEENLEYFNHLQKCDCIEKIEIRILDSRFNEEQLTTNLCNLAREMKGLKWIIFDIKNKRMKEINMKIIKKLVKKEILILEQ